MSPADSPREDRSAAAGQGSPEAPAGIDPARVTQFMAENVPGADCPLRFDLIGNGRSNITYRVSGAGGTWVLRRPPLGHVLPTAHDMAREHRVQRALRDTDVPVPRMIALCEDPDVIGCAFYVMEYANGVVVDGTRDDRVLTSETVCRAVSESVVEALATLHRQDYRALGLGDFGRPEGFLERQVRRFSQQWERSKTADEPIVTELIRRLSDALPPSPPATIVHGDYRLGNMALDADRPERIVAIYDWEMATLGDPLADLGYLLLYWTEAGEAESDGRPAATARPGFFSRAELIEAYAARSGRDVSRADYYHVLGLYKIGVIMEGIYARHLMGKTVGRQFAGMTRRSLAFFERALEVAARSPDRRLRGAA